MVFLERLTYLIHLLSIEHHKAEIKSIISAYDSTISEREIDTIINKVPLINEEHWHKICIFIEHESGVTISSISTEKKPKLMKYIFNMFWVNCMFIS